MKTTIDALVEALEPVADWMEQSANCSAGGPDHPPEPASQFDYQLLQAASEIRAALTQARAEQAEPVAWRHSHTHSLHDFEHEVELADGDSWAEPLYTTPPAAPVAKLERLTEDELRAAFENWFSNQGEWPAAIERHGNGPYLLSATQAAWVAWFNAGAVLTAAHNAKLGGAR